MSDDENTGTASKSRFSVDLQEALDKQRNIFLDELDTRFSSLSQARCSSASSSSDFKFKSEGIKAQFEFNSERLEGLLRIDALGKVSAEHVSQVVKSEVEAINQRNKLLRIADKHGWDTVREYSDSPLADDAEDAAKLRGAIARTLRNRRFRPYPDAKPSQTPGNNTGGVQRNFRSFPGRDGDQMQKRSGGGSGGAAYGSCYVCHLYGHFAKQCPYIQRNTVAAKKLNDGSDSIPVDQPTQRN